MTTLRLALAQMNPRAGDPRGNAALIRARRAEAAAAGADILLAPQGSLSGWPLLDLAREGAFRDACAAELAALAEATGDGGPALVVGAPFAEAGRLHDGLFVLDGGRILARRARHEVEGDEPFVPGPAPGPVALRGARLGLMAGPEAFGEAVPETLAETGAELLVALTAFPFAPGAAERRVDRAVAAVVATGLGFLNLNLVGAEDGLVHDGASFALNPDRTLALHLPLLEPALAVTDWTGEDDALACAPRPPAPIPHADAATWRALLLGLADQVAKFGAPGVLLPWPAEPAAELLARLAAEALGPARCGVQGGLRLTAATRTALLDGKVPAEADLAPFLHLGPTALARLGAAPPPDPQDAILDLLAGGAGTEAVAAHGHPRADVLAAWRRLARSEAARRRAPPGIRLGGRLPAFPLTQAFVDQIA
jgi:NAD+ synthase